jgi:hypothetical protein
MLQFSIFSSAKGKRSVKWKMLFRFEVKVFIISFKGQGFEIKIVESSLKR